jgi:hypothetical protein
MSGPDPVQIRTEPATLSAAPVFITSILQKGLTLQIGHWVKPKVILGPSHLAARTALKQLR